MTLLILAALLWVAVHVGISGTALRDRIVASTGAVRFMIGYSLLSVVCIVLLVMAWRAAPTDQLWFAGAGLRWVLAALMLPTLVLFMTSHKRNPTAVGGRGLGDEARGIQRVTRHPMLWSFALWATIHIIGNGDTASTLFFGAFLVTALVGMPSIDAKLAARNPADWPGFAAKTSIIPFAAIAAGRNRFVPGEIGWVAPVVGLVIWAAMLHFHRGIFGVPAVFL